MGDRRIQGYTELEVSLWELLSFDIDINFSMAHVRLKLY